MRFSLLLVSILSVLLFSGDAYAAPEDDIKALQCPPSPGKLTEAVYDCMKHIVDRLSATLITEIYTKANKAIIAMLTMAIIFFAFKFVLSGTRQPQAEFFVMLLKFTFVASLLFGISSGGGILELRDTILHTGEEVAALVTNSGAFTTGGVCPSGVSPRNIFHNMDCVIFKVYGIDPTKNLDMDGDMKGLKMFGGMILSGVVGARGFVDGMGVIALLIGAFMMALYIQVVSLIALTFLFGMSPIFVPMLLFTQTQNMFKKWTSQLMSYSLQPMIMVAFISLMLFVLSDLFGTLDATITKSAELANDPSFKKIQTVFSTSKTENSEKAPFQSILTNDGVAMTDSTVAGQGVAAGAEKQMDQRTFGVSVTGKSLIVSPLKEDELKKLGSELVMLLILCGAMFRFMRELPGWMSDLTGDRTAPNLAQQAPVQNIQSRFWDKK